MASPTLVGARDLARLNNFIAPGGSTFNKMILYLTKGGKMYHPLYLTKGGKKTRRMKIPHGYVRTHSPARPRACPGLAGRGFPSISLAEVGPDPGAESGIG